MKKTFKIKSNLSSKNKTFKKIAQTKGGGLFREFLQNSNFMKILQAQTKATFPDPANPFNIFFNQIENLNEQDYDLIEKSHKLIKQEKEYFQNNSLTAKHIKDLIKKYKLQISPENLKLVIDFFLKKENLHYFINFKVSLDFAIANQIPGYIGADLNNNIFFYNLIFGSPALTSFIDFKERYLPPGIDNRVPTNYLLNPLTGLLSWNMEYPNDFNRRFLCPDPNNNDTCFFHFGVLKDDNFEEIFKDIPLKVSSSQVQAPPMVPHSAPAAPAAGGGAASQQGGKNPPPLDKPKETVQYSKDSKLEPKLDPNNKEIDLGLFKDSTPKPNFDSDEAKSIFRGNLNADNPDIIKDITNGRFDPQTLSDTWAEQNPGSETLTAPADALNPKGLEMTDQLQPGDTLLVKFLQTIINIFFRAGIPLGVFLAEWVGEVGLNTLVGYTDGNYGSAVLYATARWIIDTTIWLQDSKTVDQLNLINRFLNMGIKVFLTQYGDAIFQIAEIVGDAAGKIAFNSFLTAFNSGVSLIPPLAIFFETLSGTSITVLTFIQAMVQSGALVPTLYYQTRNFIIVMNELIKKYTLQSAALNVDLGNMDTVMEMNAFGDPNLSGTARMATTPLTSRLVSWKLLGVPIDLKESWILFKMASQIVDKDNELARKFNSDVDSMEKFETFLLQNFAPEEARNIFAMDATQDAAEQIDKEGVKKIFEKMRKGDKVLNEPLQQLKKDLQNPEFKAAFKNGTDLRDLQLAEEAMLVNKAKKNIENNLQTFKEEDENFKFEPENITPKSSDEITQYVLKKLQKLKKDGKLNPTDYSGVLDKYREQFIKARKEEILSKGSPRDGMEKWEAERNAEQGAYQAWNNELKESGVEQDNEKEAGESWYADRTGAPPKKMEPRQLNEEKYSELIQFLKGEAAAPAPATSASSSSDNTEAQMATPASMGGIRGGGRNQYKITKRKGGYKKSNFTKKIKKTMSQFFKPII